MRLLGALPAIGGARNIRQAYRQLAAAALGGGVILIGRDGCCRGVAGVYARYYKVEETVPALRAIGQVASEWAVSRCRWWLDSPVDNAGRLKGIIREVATEAGWPWEVELVTNPDRVLSAAEQIVSSSDHAILDRCQRWFNLTRQVVANHVPHARIVDLGPDQSAQARSAGTERRRTGAEAQERAGEAGAG